MNIVKKLSSVTLALLIMLGLFVTPALAADDDDDRDSDDNGEARWHTVQGAVSYNIYYTLEDEDEWWYSVPNVSGAATSYRIGQLIDGAAYEYEVRAVNASGAEFMTVKEGTMND